MDLITKLLAVISKDKDARSTRLSLAQSLGVDDRTCRELREKAVELGHPIISTTDMAGSYLSYDRDDIQHAKSQAYNRALKEFAKVRAYDRILESLGQVTIN